MTKISNLFPRFVLDFQARSFLNPERLFTFLLVLFLGSGIFLGGCHKEILQPEDGMPYFFQTDEQYKNIWYGDGFFRDTGCGPTSLAMALSFLTSQSISPIEVAQYAQENGYYVDGVGTAWALFEEYPALYGIDVWQCVLDESLIAQQLAQNNVLILSMGPGDFTTAGHILVIKNLVNTNQTHVHDPYSPNKSKIWNLSTLLSQARASFVLTL